MSLAAVGHHLRALEGSGLVRSRKVGRVRTCQATANGMREIQRWVAARQADWDRRLNRLDRWLAAAGDSSDRTNRKDSE